MPNAILLTSQVLALMTMFGMSTCAAERRIEIPLEQSGGLPVAEVVSALAQASGVTIERPAIKLTLPRRILGPPILSFGYWTDESALGTFDHHEAGRVDVRPGQGLASRCGESEHGTAESRGGRGRG